MSDETPPRIELAILAKAPVPGFAKTRLIAHLGREGAAALQRWLLQRTVATAVISDIGPLSLWCAPDAHHPDFAHCRAFGNIRLLPQPEGELGARMHAAVAASRTPAGTLVIGTDCPLLTPALIRRAAAALQQHDAVVVPAEDGGYVLIALRHPQPQLFEGIDWSTEHVMAQTRARMRDLGLRWHEAGRLWDVDRAQDFERLAARIPDVRGVVAPRARA